MIQIRDALSVIVGGVIVVVVYAGLVNGIAMLGLAPEPGEPMYWLLVGWPEAAVQAVSWTTAGVGVGGVLLAWRAVSGSRF